MGRILRLIDPLCLIVEIAEYADEILVWLLRKIKHTMVDSPRKHPRSRSTVVATRYVPLVAAASAQVMVTEEQSVNVIVFLNHPA
jgi:hypothetical protein